MRGIVRGQNAQRCKGGVCFSKGHAWHGGGEKVVSLCCFGEGTIGEKVHAG